MRARLQADPVLSAKRRRENNDQVSDVRIIADDPA
jgi:hypothetical protein